MENIISVFIVLMSSIVALHYLNSKMSPEQILASGDFFQKVLSNLNIKKWLSIFDKFFSKDKDDNNDDKDEDKDIE